MAQLVVQLESEEKARMLSEFLSALTFVSSVELTEEETTQEEAAGDFFALSGLWKDRDIDQESIRKNAWPEQNQ